MTGPILAIDPGGAQTGIVVRDGDQLTSWAIVERDKAPMGDYIAEVLDAIWWRWDKGMTVAVEGLVAPTGHVRNRPINVQGLIDCAQVLGAILATFTDAVIVRPGRHGHVDLDGYPDTTARRILQKFYPGDLIGERETRGTGRLRHARSAWDIAGATTRGQ